MRIFLSHSSKDYEAAVQICKLVEENGHSCFFAPRDIRTGHEYAEEIIDGIESADVLLLLLSKSANSSPHVLREVERAVSKRIAIVVYKIEEVELTKSMEYFLMMHQWVNAQAGADYGEILQALNVLSEREAAEDNKKLNMQEAESVKEKATDGIARKNLGKKRWAWSVCLFLIVILTCVGTGVLIGKDKEDTSLEEVLPEVSLGDTIVLGNYNGLPIEWRVLKLAEDGKSAVVVAKDIISMKAFDAAESGKYNYYGDKDYWGVDVAGESAELQQMARGDNRWSTSNLRTWLNSDNENVKYQDQAPIVNAMSERCNGYDTEQGFLKSFSDEELTAILVTDVKTGDVITQDRVFLLSREELSWFDNADVKRAAEPTQAALEQDLSQWYEFDTSACGVTDYYWWLRDADETNAYKVYLACSSYSEKDYITKGAGLEGFGIRPAMTVDLTSEYIVVQ